MPTDEKGTQIQSSQAIVDADLFFTVHNVATTPVTKTKTGTLIKTWLKAYLDTLYPTSGPQGFGDNYVITPSISTNNLVVEMKTIAGVDPSTSDPIPFRIGNTKRTLTAALSLTVTAGTSIFNAGATEFAAKKIQLFVYIGWRAASSTIFLGLSRMPGGRTYADFSATSTNELYLAYTGSAPASTDVVEVIGRIDAQNSGTASYNWSLPSGAVVVNKPIHFTNWLTYVPTITGYSANPTNAVYRYRIVVEDCFYEMQEGTAGTSNATTKTYSMPFTSKTLTNMAWGGSVITYNNGVLDAMGYVQVNSNSAIATMYRSGAAVWTASGAANVFQVYGKFPLI